jgi:hypothetical protein
MYRALTTFETGISPWMYPSEWLDANMEPIRSVFDGIVGSTENADIKAMQFPASPIFQVSKLTHFLEIGGFTYRSTADNCIQHASL